jgi:hypothetical protein
MDADPSVQVRIRRPPDGSRRPACGQPCNIDALRIDRMFTHDLMGDARNQRRFTSVPPLVARAKPVPAFRLICSGRLLWVGDEAVLLFGEEVHPRTSRKIVGRLGAAVKHDN